MSKSAVNILLQGFKCTDALDSPELISRKEIVGSWSNF